MKSAVFIFFFFFLILFNALSEFGAYYFFKTSLVKE